ncbi:MAG TPA: hypothetical protein VMI53_01935, partial [Opitutaceae bacterium]|nr:hypothetical protein [Opitutaceae bacterium]
MSARSGYFSVALHFGSGFYTIPLMYLLVSAASRWMRTGVLGLLIGFVCFSYPAVAATVVDSVDPHSLISPALPSWIRPPLPLPSIPAANGSAVLPVRMLVVEQQINVPLQEEFVHNALRVETEA